MCTFNHGLTTPIASQINAAKMLATNLRKRRIKHVSKSLYTTPEHSVRHDYRDDIIQKKHAQNIASRMSVTMSKPTTTSSKSPRFKNKNYMENYISYEKRQNMPKTAYGSILEQSGSVVSLYFCIGLI